MTNGLFAMRLSAQLRDALGRYRRIEDDVAAVRDRSDAERKQALVNSRRQLSEQIGQLGPVIEGDVDLAQDPDKQKEISRLFTAMRYSLALHQASWPAVKIDEDPAAYRASSLGVKEKSDAFWSWWQSNLGLRRDQLGA